MTPPARASFSKTVTDADVTAFSEVSGDRNLLHVDDAFAATTRFKKRVVHGALLASYFSQLVGMHLGTPYVLYAGQTLSFKNPVFLGDTVVVSFELKSYSEAVKLATYAAQVTCNGVVCVEGEAKVLFL